MMFKRLIQKGIKHVNYYGHPLVVPASAYYIAADFDGNVFTFPRKPYIEEGFNYWMADDLDDDVHCVAWVEFDNPNEWKQSLALVEEVRCH